MNSPQPDFSKTFPSSHIEDSVPWKNWTILTLKETPSTNETARHLPPWTAVVADRQTAGKGRHGRKWISDQGGLWLSAVLPTPGDPHRWNPLPLAVGLAVIRTLSRLQVTVRMRWPNDIMAGDLKLAGLLLERYDKERIIAGIGVNLTNSPASEAPELTALTTQLCNLTPSPPSRDEFLILLLNHLHEIHQHMQQEGVTPLIPELNRMWGQLPRPVELHIDHQIIAGDFMGITRDGDLILRDPSGKTHVHSSAHVALLREKFYSPSTPTND